MTDKQFNENFRNRLADDLAITDGSINIADMSVFKSLRVVNQWLSEYEKIVTKDVDAMLADIRNKLRMIGIETPEISSELIDIDEDDEGTIEVEAQLFPKGQSSQLDGQVTDNTDLFGEKTGDQLIFVIDWEEENGNISILPQLTTESDLEEDEEDFDEDEEEDDDDEMDED